MDSVLKPAWDKYRAEGWILTKDYGSRINIKKYNETKRISIQNGIPVERMMIPRWKWRVAWAALVIGILGAGVSYHRQHETTKPPATPTAILQLTCWDIGKRAYVPC